MAVDVQLLHIGGNGLDELLALGLAVSGALVATVACTRRGGAEAGRDEQQDAGRPSRD
jgi:hypothetical protein